MKIDINKLDFKKVSDNIYQINHDKDVIKFWSPKICVPFGIDKDYDKYYIRLELDEVFRKLHQPAASPAAQHPGYSISEDRLRYCSSVGSAQYRNDGDIQALLGAAEFVGDKNLLEEKNNESHIYFKKVISHIEKLIKKKLDVQDNEFKSVIRNRGPNKTELIECRIKNFKKNFQTTVEYEDKENNYLKTIFDIEKQCYVKVLCEIYGLWDYRNETKENNKIGLILYATKIIVLK